MGVGFGEVVFDEKGFKGIGVVWGDDFTKKVGLFVNGLIKRRTMVDIWGEGRV